MNTRDFRGLKIFIGMLRKFNGLKRILRDFRGFKGVLGDFKGFMAF